MKLSLPIAEQPKDNTFCVSLTQPQYRAVSALNVLFDSWRTENTNKYSIVANFGTCYWWPSQSDPPVFTKTYDWGSLYQLIVEEYVSAAEKAYARRVGNYATTPLSLVALAVSWLCFLVTMLTLLLLLLKTLRVL